MARAAQNYCASRSARKTRYAPDAVARFDRRDRSTRLSRCPPADRLTHLVRLALSAPSKRHSAGRRGCRAADYSHTSRIPFAYAPLQRCIPYRKRSDIAQVITEKMNLRYYNGLRGVLSSSPRSSHSSGHSHCGLIVLADIMGVGWVSIGSFQRASCRCWLK